MKKLILFLVIPFIMILNSCLINPDTETLGAEVMMSLPAGSIPSGTAGFHVFILNSYVADPENFNPQNEEIFYEKKILTESSDVLTSTPSANQTYDLKLSNIPEGENLYMLIYYISANPDYSMLSGSSGFFYTYSPFSVSRGNTTAVYLTGSINWQRLVLINDIGDAWYSRDSYSWYGPYSTGLSQSRSIEYAKGRFIAAGQINGTNYGVSVSYDGINWSVRDLGAAGSLTNILANSSGSFLATGIQGVTGHAYRSSDGSSWEGLFPTGIFNMQGLAWQDSYWFTAGSTGSPLRKSLDGETWIDAPGLPSIPRFYVIRSVNGRLIGGGGIMDGTQKQTRTSSDGGDTFGGIINVTGATNYVFAFAADPVTNRVIALGGGTNPVTYSDNYGVSWTAVSGITAGSTFNAAAHWKNGFLTANDSGELYASADGFNFGLRYNFGAFTKIRGIAYNNVP